MAPILFQSLNLNGTKYIYLMSESGFAQRAGNTVTQTSHWSQLERGLGIGRRLTRDSLPLCVFSNPELRAAPPSPPFSYVYKTHE